MELRAGELPGCGPKAAPEGGFPEESSASSQQTSSRQRGSVPDSSNGPVRPPCHHCDRDVARIESRLRAWQKRCARLSDWLAQRLPRGLASGTAGRVERDRRLDVDHLRFGRRGTRREATVRTPRSCVRSRASRPLCRAEQEPDRWTTWRVPVRDPKVLRQNRCPLHTALMASLRTGITQQASA
jgi:hypothetical protein